MRATTEIRRSAAALLVAAVAITGCVDDRSGAVAAPGRSCAAAAGVVDVLQDSGGAVSTDAPMRSAFDDLAAAVVEEGDEAGAEHTIRGLLALLAASDESLADDDEDAWYDGLTDLDERIAGLCGFSMRVLVADRVSGAASDPDDVDRIDDEASEEDDGGPLNWDAIRRRLPDAEWVDDGYDGIVGIGPGVYVTVSGVPSRERALDVCVDVLDALAPEAAEGDVEVRVEGLGGDVFAIAYDGACIGAP